MTPRKLCLLLERKAERRKQEQRRLAEQIGLVRADLINFSMCHPQEHVRLESLLPWVASERVSVVGRARKRRLSAKKREEIAQGWRMFMAAQP